MGILMVKEVSASTVIEKAFGVPGEINGSRRSDKDGTEVVRVECEIGFPLSVVFKVMLLLMIL